MDISIITDLERERDDLRAYVGDEMVRSDYRTAAEMRAELNELRRQRDAAISEIGEWARKSEALADALGKISMVAYSYRDVLRNIEIRDNALAAYRLAAAGRGAAIYNDIQYGREVGI